MSSLNESTITKIMYYVLEVNGASWHVSMVGTKLKLSSSCHVRLDSPIAHATLAHFFSLFFRVFSSPNENDKQEHLPLVD